MGTFIDFNLLGWIVLISSPILVFLNAKGILALKILIAIAVELVLIAVPGFVELGLTPYFRVILLILSGGIIILYTKRIVAGKNKKKK